MSLTPHATCRLKVVLSSVVLLGLARVASADPKPLPKAEQAKVDKAIDKAIAYLRRTQTKEGNWPTRFYKRYLVGECALPAYALLEAGVPANDPVIQKAADFIRPKVANTDDTYELALAVLFFDRLDDAKDKKLIQTCALRLIAGQYWTGGWSYICPRLKESQDADLLAALQELSELLKERKSNKEVLKDLALPDNIVIWPQQPPWDIDSRIDYGELRRKMRNYQLPRSRKGFKGLAVFQDLEKLNWREQNDPPTNRGSIPLVGTTDNSNTQFALLALWVAQRHGIPADSSFRLLVKRFERAQIPNGGWIYTTPMNGHDYAHHLAPSMTCVGLLGLAIGRGLKLPSPSDSPQAGKGDIRIVAGLAALYSKIGVPTGQWDMPSPTRKEDMYKRDVYFLWSLERVGMLFNLPTFGDKEWYRWGAEVLVANQLETGAFNTGAPNDASLAEAGGLYGPILKTAFALLFLKRSHPMKDLTPKLPFTARELNEGIARLRPSDADGEGSTAPPSRSTKPER